MLAGLHFLDLQMIQRGPWALVLALSLSLAGVSHLQTFLHTWLASLRQMLPAKPAWSQVMTPLQALVLGKWVSTCLCRLCRSRLEVPGAPTRIPAHLPSKRL